MTNPFVEYKAVLEDLWKIRTLDPGEVDGRYYNQETIKIATLMYWIKLAVDPAAIFPSWDEVNNYIELFWEARMPRAFIGTERYSIIENTLFKQLAETVGAGGGSGGGGLTTIMTTIDTTSTNLPAADLKTTIPLYKFNAVVASDINFTAGNITGEGVFYLKMGLNFANGSPKVTVENGAAVTARYFGQYGLFRCTNMDGRQWIVEQVIPPQEFPDISLKANKIRRDVAGKVSMDLVNVPMDITGFEVIDRSIVPPLYLGSGVSTVARFSSGKYLLVDGMQPGNPTRYAIWNSALPQGTPIQVIYNGTTAAGWQPDFSFADQIVAISTPQIRPDGTTTAAFNENIWLTGIITVYNDLIDVEQEIYTIPTLQLVSNNQGSTNTTIPGDIYKTSVAVDNKYITKSEGDAAYATIIHAADHQPLHTSPSIITNSAGWAAYLASLSIGHTYTDYIAVQNDALGSGVYNTTYIANITKTTSSQYFITLTSKDRQVYYNVGNTTTFARVPFGAEVYYWDMDTGWYGTPPNNDWDQGLFVVVYKFGNPQSNNPTVIISGITVNPTPDDNSTYMIGGLNHLDGKMYEFYAEPSQGTYTLTEKHDTLQAVATAQGTTSATIPGNIYKTSVADENQYITLGDGVSKWCVSEVYTNPSLLSGHNLLFLDMTTTNLDGPTDMIRLNLMVEDRNDNSFNCDVWLENRITSNDPSNDTCYGRAFGMLRNITDAPFIKVFVSPPSNNYSRQYQFYIDGSAHDFTGGITMKISNVSIMSGDTTYTPPTIRTPFTIGSLPSSTLLLSFSGANMHYT